MIRIITDSTCDLRPARRETLGIDVVPLSVHFGEEVFRDGIDITNEEFYRCLSRAEKLPTTSQVNPEVFAALFQSYVDQGDEVVGIFLSSAMSGTCQSAVIAKGMVDEGEIHIVDSRTVTFALGLLVERAVALRDAGRSAAEIAGEIASLTGRVRLLAVVDTLKYLKMGGRINAPTAVVGGLLGINPIITVENGLVESIGKARGRKAAFQWMADFLEKERPDLSLPVAFGNSNAPEAMAECKSFFREAIVGAEILESDIGSVVGTHAGPGATGLVYFVKE
jgi:DegV family protein with EDD domain